MLETAPSAFEEVALHSLGGSIFDCLAALATQASGAKHLALTIKCVLRPIFVSSSFYGHDYFG